MARTTREQWERRVARWRRSGLTTREFAAREGLRASTLAYWRWRLKTESRSELQTGAAGSAATAGAVRMREMASAPADFVGFEVVAAPAGGRDVEIIVDGALRVRVAPGFDEATLRRVVSVLREGAR